MKDMKKDGTIEEKFRRYFSGTEAPECDLAEAKRALAAARAQEKKRRRARNLKRGVGVAAASLAACLILVFCLLSVLLPFTATYSIAEAAAETAAYSDLKETYGGQIGGLSVFSLAENASAEYTLYTLDGTDVLLRADVAVVSGTYQLKGTVWINLAVGDYKIYVAEELKEYQNLSRGNQDVYLYETEYLNGEYVSRAYRESEAAIYYVDVMSPSYGALRYLMEVIA